MPPPFSVTYDPVGDVVYLESCLPYGEQRSVMEADGVVYRRNPDSGEIERIEILSFRRWQLADLADLPIDARLKDVLAALSTYARAA
ncbi:MAG: DUF2283 domain-containing protein [bacterium]